MAQNVTIAGNQYPNVPSVLIPKTGGGGNAIFADPSVVTAVAADVASGKYFLNSSGVLTQGTASGGASNIVTGTFTGTTTGAAMDITLNYSGSGHPVALMIYPKEGTYNKNNGDFYTLIQRYSIQYWSAAKYEIETTPTYLANSYSDSHTENAAVVAYRYKYSTSNPVSFSGSANYTNLYRNSNAADTIAACVRIKSAKIMSVFIASTSYGFAANIEYKYWVIYSS